MKSYLPIIFFLIVVGCSSKNREEIFSSEGDSIQTIQKEPDNPINEEAINEKKDKDTVSDYIKKFRSDKAKRDSIFAQLDTTYWFNDSAVTVIGIIQSSGIIESDNLGVKAKFQLINPNKSFFLQTDEDLSPYWGNCVKVSGKYLDGWNYKSGEFRDDFKFGRTAIHVETIKLVSNDYCNNSPIFIPILENSFVKHSRDSIYECYIQRIRRPAPDIGYDYQAKLLEPVDLDYEEFKDIMQLPLSINISLDTLNFIIENNKKVSVYGIIKGGYAEGIVLQCKEYIDYK